MDYKKHYDLLINRAKNRLLETYTEKHHIIPRCMGGNNLPENLVRLTPEEHYIAHQLLVKIYPDNLKLLHAANMMAVSNNKQVRNNKRYGWLKRRLSENVEWKEMVYKIFKENRPEHPPTFGKKWYNNEIDSKMFFDSEVPDGWKRGRIFKFKSQDSKNAAIKNLSASGHNKGKQTPDETKQKISKSLKGRKKPKQFGEKRKGELNPAYGSTYIWVNDGVKNYRWNDKNNIPSNLQIGMIK